MKDMKAELESNQFFNWFSPASRARLAAGAKTQNFPDGAVLFAEGDPPDFVYLLLKGQVELIKSSREGRPVVISTVSPGDYFGEIVLLESGARNTGARTKGEVTAAKIPCGDVLDVLEAEPADVTRQLWLRVLRYLRATDELLVAEAVRQEKMNLIGAMAGSIIHDFRIPLTCIHLAAQMMVEERKDAPTLKCCEVIERQTYRMVGMIQELLEYSRGQSALKREAVPVAELFESFRFLNEEFMKDCHVRLVLYPIEAKVYADSERLLRVLQNLVGNAVDALEPAGGEICLEARENEDGVDISVSDNGPGIPEPIRARLFEPFVTHGKKHGTGLGMAIAKTLVEAHGGKISFTTETGRGTTFRIHLPACPN